MEKRFVNRLSNVGVIQLNHLAGFNMVDDATTTAALAEKAIQFAAQCFDLFGLTRRQEL